MRYQLQTLECWRSEEKWMNPHYVGINCCSVMDLNLLLPTLCSVEFNFDLLGSRYDVVPSVVPCEYEISCVDPGKLAIEDRLLEETPPVTLAGVATPSSSLFQWWWPALHIPPYGPDGWSRLSSTGGRGWIDGQVDSDARDWCGHVGTKGCGVMDLPYCFRLWSVELNLDLLYSSDDGTVPCVDQMAEVEHRVLVAEDGLMGESTLMPVTGADM